MPHGSPSTFPHTTPESTQLQCDNPSFMMCRLHSHHEPPRDPSLPDSRFLVPISLPYFCSLSSAFFIMCTTFLLPGPLICSGLPVFSPRSLSQAAGEAVCPCVLQCAVLFLPSAHSSRFQMVTYQLTSKCQPVCRDFKLHGDKPFLELLLF